MSGDRTKSPIYVLVYAAAISGIFTAGIMTVHAITRPIVERNQQLFFQKAMVELFGLGDVDELSDRKIASLYEGYIGDYPKLIDPRTGREFTVYMAVDRDKQTIGYAFSVSGVGFWARIDGYLAVTEDLKQAIGIAFLSHQETPGLGGRITERTWREKFAGLDLTPPEGAGPIIYIGGDKPEQGSPAFGRHVDAITGATGTSEAVEKFLNEQIAAFRRAWDAQPPLPPEYRGDTRWPDEEERE
ncbi:MAG: FMN-binding protein [Planctomycetota bacterium]|jgi:Na+-transporting NADH:ubiquinone oxidoreductase subunit C